MQAMQSAAYHEFCVGQRTWRGDKRLHGAKTEAGAVAYAVEYCRKYPREPVYVREEWYDAGTDQFKSRLVWVNTGRA